VSYEHKVELFYDSALHCYMEIMGDRWHHGDPDATAAGLPRIRCCEIMEERVVALLGLGSGGKALDFGSGIGGPTCHMARVTGASFVGVCDNERLNTVGREKIAALGLAGRVSFLTTENTGYKSLPFPDDTFDAVTFFESICHVSDKPALFRELARVLKPGGRLGGEDWVQRPFGEHQTEEQIMTLMGPVNELFVISGHGTVEGYRDMMALAGLDVLVARDLFPGVICWGATQDDEKPRWLGYEGDQATMFRDGERALLLAREAGVFSLGMWIAQKPPSGQPREGV
jgi:tocopherol O-methyltransferase